MIVVSLRGYSIALAFKGQVNTQMNDERTLGADGVVKWNQSINRQ